MKIITLKDNAELIKYYSKYSKVISEFFVINDDTLSADNFCKKAITGSTYRSFHKIDSDSGDGMSKIFKLVANDFYAKNPTKDTERNEFIDRLKKRSNGKFKNWSPDDAGMPKLFKIYNLYSAYWVAFNQKGSFDSKQKSLSKLKVPLDKYSLTFIRDLYNSCCCHNDFKLSGDLSMGKVKSTEHYNSINQFIDSLCKSVSKEMGIDFFPIYLDIIQVECNGLNWYSNVTKKSRKLRGK
jgi:hypothetical protein